MTKLLPLIVSTVLSIVALACLWYVQPARIESMNRMLYCSCGYSEVEFRNGIITMIKYHHASVVPGDVIGEYEMIDGKARLTISFKDEKHSVMFEIDNIGLINPQGSLWKYHAYDNSSIRSHVYSIFSRIFD